MSVDQALLSSTSHQLSAALALLALGGEDVLADERPHRHVRVALVQLAHTVQSLELDHAGAFHYLSTLDVSCTCTLRCKHAVTDIYIYIYFVYNIHTTSKGGRRHDAS